MRGSGPARPRHRGQPWGAGAADAASVPTAVIAMPTLSATGLL